jgi:Tol biopolymer transport system component
VQLTREDLDVRTPVFSPDGALIVFRSERAGGGLYVMPSAGGAPVLLAPGGRDPQFSPDGKWVAYWTGHEFTALPDADITGRTSIVSTSGGAPRQVGAEFEISGYPMWAPDSKHLLVYANIVRPLWVPRDPGWWVVPIQGGAAHRTGAFALLEKHGFSTNNSNYELPRVRAWRGDRLVFSARLGDSVNNWEAQLSSTGSRMGGKLRRLTAGSNLEVGASLGADGALVFASVSKNTAIYLMSPDTDSGRVTGKIERVVQQAGFETHPSVSLDGRLLAYISGKSRVLRLRDLQNGSDRALPGTGHGRPELSPDGSRLAYPSASGDKSSIWTLSLADGSATRLWEGFGAVYGWSPDNRFFTVATPRTNEIFRVDAFTGKRSQSLFRRGLMLFQSRVSPDGRWILVEAVPANATESRLFVAPLRDGIGPAAEAWIPVGFSNGWDDKPRWSPDGNTMYFLSDQHGFLCIWAQRLDPATKRPRNAPFPVYHFHSARLSPKNVGLGPLDMGVARDKIVINLGELTGNIWRMRR